MGVTPSPPEAFGVALEDDPRDEGLLSPEEAAQEEIARAAQDEIERSKSRRGETEKEAAVRRAQIVDGLVSRKVVKQTVMTSVDGVTEVGAITVDGDADDDELYHCACYVASLTLEVLEELFTSARQLMAWMAQCARLVAQHDQPVSWITPLGLPVVQPYRRDGQHAVRTLAQTVVLVDHSDKLPVSVT